MGNREQYNKCMVPYMKGGGDDRKLRFCIGAKLCSGKSKTEEEAKALCSLPKEPKPAKTRKSGGGAKSCEKEVTELAQCMLDYFEENGIYQQVLNINSVGVAMTNALLECKRCQG